MARRLIKRLVCKKPKCEFLYSNMNSNFINILSFDEFETIRAIDLENLSQEQCAKMMNVARTTVQQIYSNARHKIAKYLVQGGTLRIEGGEFCFCGGNNSECLFYRFCQKKKENAPLIIAINSDSQNDIFDLSSSIEIYQINQEHAQLIDSINLVGKTKDERVMILLEREIDAIVCFEASSNFRNQMNNHGIRIFSNIKENNQIDLIQSIKQILYK